MLNHLNIRNWTPFKVRDWLKGVCDETNWLRSDILVKGNIGGEELIMMTSQDLENLGATKVNLQEHILEAIENLRHYDSCLTRETLQTSILKLACQSRSLQRQLVHERSVIDHDKVSGTRDIILSPEFENNALPEKQRVSLDTLTSVSAIVAIVSYITDVLNCLPFSKYDDYRSMKSLLLALSIELTSTAQRDQFVEQPNDIIEKSSKVLADYCDKIVQGTRDPLLIQPFQLETVKIKKNSNDNDFGLLIKSPLTSHTHVIEKISPLSPAKKTNKLHEGDEIVQFNQNIVGWSSKNVEKLLDASSQMNDLILMVKKCPSE